MKLLKCGAVIVVYRVEMKAEMLDKYGRKIEYLRLSVTELCNLRCRYCMPESGVVNKNHEEMLTQEEMLRAVHVCADLGIKKVRITGGEPLVKKNILSICQGISEINGVEELCLTTNGTFLSQMALPLRKSGVSRINISLDTLDEDKYKNITRCGELRAVLDGIDRALSVGFDRVSINAVLMSGVNDDMESINKLADFSRFYPVDVRFIELMPMLETAEDNMVYSGSDNVLKCLELNKIYERSSVCRYYKLSNAKGRIGIISPMSHKFCDACNKIRITADGKVRPCLHSSLEYSIKGMDDAGMADILKKAVENKPKEHYMNETARTDARRYMSTIGG